jgi:hypothetical protein
LRYHKEVKLNGEYPISLRNDLINLKLVKKNILVP